MLFAADNMFFVANSTSSVADNMLFVAANMLFAANQTSSVAEHIFVCGKLNFVRDGEHVICGR